MANNGNPNIKERPNSKSALAVKVKKTLMEKLEEGQSIIKTNCPNTDMSNDQ